MDFSFIKVVAIQDESSHWYVIPEHMREDFNKLEEEMAAQDNALISGKEYEGTPNPCGAFDTMFSKYRTGGSVNGGPQLYIMVNNEEA